MSACAADLPEPAVLRLAVDRLHRALPLCVLLSGIAHVGLLTLRLPVDRPGQRPGGSSPPTALQVRLVEKPSAPPARSALPAVAPTAATPAPSLKATDPPAIDAPRPQKATPTTGPSKNNEPALTSLSSDATPIMAAPSLGNSRDEYVPRPQLTVPPIAQAPVIIASPPGEPPAGRQAGILSLFINEDGSVHHITADEPRLPPAFEAAAREAFMAARFKPGELDGEAVKSRLRVEVVFESTAAKH